MVDLILALSHYPYFGLERCSLFEWVSKIMIFLLWRSWISDRHGRRGRFSGDAIVRKRRQAEERQKKIQKWKMKNADPSLEIADRRLPHSSFLFIRCFSFDATLELNIFDHPHYFTFLTSFNESPPKTAYTIILWNLKSISFTIFVFSSNPTSYPSPFALIPQLWPWHGTHTPHTHTHHSHTHFSLPVLDSMNNLQTEINTIISLC